MILTQEQKIAVNEIKQNLLIIAGPGSGKTTIIAEKVALLLKNNYKTSNILITTYTNKAKEQLKNKILTISNNLYHNLQIYTIHQLCRNIIREFSHLITPHIIYTMDEIDQRFFLINNHQKLKLNTFTNNDNFFEHIFKLFSFFDAINEHNINLDELKLFTKKRDKKSREFNSLSDKGILLTDREIVQIFIDYRQFMWKNKILDLSQTLKFTYTLLSKNKNIRDVLSKRFKYILIDEYQDISYLQHEIYKMLISKHNKICAVGDDKQGIYEFRGASYNNINNFKNDFPNVITTFINRNFRSTSNIVTFSNSVIKHSKKNFQKHLISKREYNPKVVLIKNNKSTDVARDICRIIKHFSTHNIISSYDDITLLFYSVRWKFIGEGYKEVFEKENIPFNIYKSGDFFEEKTINTLISILKLIKEKNFFYTNLMDFIEEIPIDDITTIFAKIPKHKNIDFLEIEPYRLKSYYKLTSEEDIYKLTKVYNFYQKIQNNPTISTLDIVYELFTLNEQCKNAILNKDKFTLLQLAYITELALYHEKWGEKSIYDFIDSLLILKDKKRIDSIIEEKKDGVNINTIHNTKGLEYKTVFLCDFDLFDHPISGFNIHHELLSKKDKHSSQADQKIRLLYTGLTRAKDYLFLAYPRVNKFGKQNKNIKHYIIQNAIKENKITKLSNIEEVNINLHNDFNNIEEHKDIQSGQIKYTPITLSFSRIKQYLTCPFSYALKYIYKFREKEQFKSKFGELIHRVLEKIHFVSLEGKERFKKENLYKLLEKQAEQLNLSINKQDLKKYKSLGGEILNNYLDSEYDNFRPHIKGVEKHFEIYSGVNKIVGSIDLILTDKNNSFRIIDFKTGEENDFAEKQLLLYAYALIKEGLTISSLSLYYLKHSKIVSYTVDRTKLENIETEINEIFKLIGQEKLKPKPNFATCLKCYFQIICPYKEI